MEVKTKTIMIPPQVEELLRYLEGCGWWPFALQVDAPWLNNLWLRFGKTVNLMETFLRFESWQYDRASKGKPLKNHRLAFRNFCENAEKFRQQAQRPKPVQPKPPIPHRQDVMGLAAGLASSKTAAINPPMRSAPPQRLTGMMTKAAERPLKTEEELEANRQQQLTDYRKKREEGNAE